MFCPTLIPSVYPVLIPSAYPTLVEVFGPSLVPSVLSHSNLKCFVPL